MKLAECKEAVEAGQTAKLVIPQTYAHGVEVVIRIKQQGGRLHQEVEILSDGQPLSKRNAIGVREWHELYNVVGGMQQRSTEWVICDDPVEPIA